MTILLALWSWITGHSPREIMIGCAVLALGLFCSYEIVHQRNIGYDECEADHAKVQAKAQAIADKESAKANQAVHDQVARDTQYLPDYLRAYHDTSKPADANCPPVQYVRKLKP